MTIHIRTDVGRLLRQRVHLAEARQVRLLPAGTEVVTVQPAHRVVLLAGETEAVRRHARALAVQAAIGVVVVGALHKAVLPHDAPDAAQVVEDVEVEGRLARRSIERGVAPVDEDLIQIAVIIEDVAAVLDGVVDNGHRLLTWDIHQLSTAQREDAGERFRSGTDGTYHLVSADMIGRFLLSAHSIVGVSENASVGKCHLRRQI